MSEDHPCSAALGIRMVLSCSVVLGFLNRYGGEIVLWNEALSPIAISPVMTTYTSGPQDRVSIAVASYFITFQFYIDGHFVWN